MRITMNACNASHNGNSPELVVEAVLFKNRAAALRFADHFLKEIEALWPEEKKPDAK